MTDGGKRRRELKGRKNKITIIVIYKLIY